MTNSILKSVFNVAVQAAIANVKPKLQALEAQLNGFGLPANHSTRLACEALHAALAEELANADTLGSSGGVHTNTGGSDKGDAE